MKKVTVVSLVCDAPSGPPLHSYQILSKYVQGYRSYDAHKDASTDRRMDGRTNTMLNSISPEPIGRGIKMGNISDVTNPRII